MKVVCLRTLRQARSPYERNPYCPPSGDELVDVSPWRLRLPIQRGQPWVTVESQVELPTWEWSPRRELEDARERLARRKAIQGQTGHSERIRESSPSGPGGDQLDIAVGSSAADSLALRASVHPSMRQSTPSSAAEPTPDESTLAIESSIHRLRKHGMDMRCFRSSSSHSLESPPSLSDARQYDLYLHQGANVVKVWYASSNGSWAVATVDMEHPKHSDYRLHISSDNWARWLLKKTVSTYRSRQGRTRVTQSAPNVLRV